MPNIDWHSSVWTRCTHNQIQSRLEVNFRGRFVEYEKYVCSLDLSLYAVVIVVKFTRVPALIVNSICLPWSLFSVHFTIKQRASIGPVILGLLIVKGNTNISHADALLGSLQLAVQIWPLKSSVFHYWISCIVSPLLVTDEKSSAPSSNKIHWM